tara:strand:+ start:2852 stop:3574 length:723 start_codon:yes stop_codon:yes gene_type:complete
MVLTACAVQTEEIEESVQELVSTAISLPIIPTAQSVEALTLSTQAPKPPTVEALTIPTETPTEIPTRDVVENSSKFANGEATALVKARIHNELVNVSDNGDVFDLIQRNMGREDWVDNEERAFIPEYWTIYLLETNSPEETSTRSKCVPLIQTYFGLVETDDSIIKKYFVHKEKNSDEPSPTPFKINEEGGLQFTEMYQAEHQAWYVSLNHGGTFDDHYIWKVYESTGTVEKFDIPRDYC